MRKHDAYIRLAQASEIFRHSYSKYAKSSVKISVADLDEIVRERYVRPSVFINCFGLLGSCTGLLSSLLPQKYSKELERVVDDVTVRQFNDSIRDITLAKNDCDEDLNLTLKFHREMRLSMEKNESNLQNNNDIFSPLSNGLYFALKTALKY